MAKKFINFALHDSPQFGESAYLVGYIGTGEVRIPVDSLSGMFSITGSAGVGSITGASNLGAGSGIYSGESSGLLNFYSIIGGQNVNIIKSGASFLISAQDQTALWGSIGGSITGQADLVSALGEKVNTGDFAAHESLTSGAHGISYFGSSLTSAANAGAALSALGISDYVNNGSNVGVGSGIFKQANAGALEFYSFVAGNFVTIVKSGDNYIISSTASGGGAATWGSIGGTLSSQTDLYNQLLSKTNTGDFYQLSGLVINLGNDIDLVSGSLATTNSNISSFSGDFLSHESLTSGAHGITEYGFNYAGATGNASIISLLGLGGAAFQDSSYFSLASHSHNISDITGIYVTGAISSGAGVSIYDSILGKDLIFKSINGSGDIQVFAQNGVIQVGYSSPVLSVFGRTGIITATSGDYDIQKITYAGASPSYYTPTEDSTYGHFRGIDNAFGAIVEPTVLSVFSRTGDVISQSGDYNVQQISYTGTAPTNYTPTDLSIYGHLRGIDSALAAGPSASVSSVFSRTGAITAQSGDYNANQINYAAVPTNYTKTNNSIEGHFQGIDSVLGSNLLSISSITGDLNTISGNLTSHESLTSGAHGITSYGFNFISSTGNSQINSLLGLGTAAFQNIGYFATSAQGSLADSAIQSGDLGSAAFLNAGTSANNLVQLDTSGRYPPIDGSQITNLPSPSVDASTVTYTPATNAHWDSVADPGNVDDALDQLANRLTNFPIFDQESAPLAGDGVNGLVPGPAAEVTLSVLSQDGAWVKANGIESLYSPSRYSQYNQSIDGQFEGIDIKFGEVNTLITGEVNTLSGLINTTNSNLSSLSSSVSSLTGDLSTISGNLSTHAALTSGAHGITEYGANFTSATGNSQINSLLGLGTAAFQSSSSFASTSHNHIVTEVSGAISGVLNSGTGINVFDSVVGQSLALKSIVGSGDIQVSEQGGTISIGYSVGASSSVASSKETITQSSHGFSAGDVLTFTSSVWTKAKADSDTTADALGVVESSTDANNFVIVYNGKITGLSGLTANTPYFLSSSVAGGITSTEPTGANVSKPILYAISTTEAIVTIERGLINGDPDEQLTSVAGLSYSGNAGKAIAVNSSEDGFELKRLLFGSIALIEDQKTTGTNGGTCTAGAWNTRVLNTIVFDPDSIVSLSSNQITLGAGTYILKATCPAYGTNQHQTRLRNITDGSTTKMGSCHHTWASDNSSDNSHLTAAFTIASSKVFEIQHRFTTSRGAGDMGLATGWGDYEVYTQVEIYKLS